MNSLKSKILINNILYKLFKVKIELLVPRGTIIYAKDYFKRKPLNVIEIGTYEGDHAKSLIQNLNINKLYCIDPYDKYLDYSISESGLSSKVVKAEVTARNKLKRYKGKVIFLKEFSENSTILKGSEMFDLIYIDGNHAYEYVKKDIELYYPLLVKGGILSGHDFYEGCGVIKAVTEFCNKNNLSLMAGKNKDWWIIKEEYNGK